MKRALENADDSNALVRVVRTLERGTIDGYVEMLGRDFFLMLVIGDGIRYAGFQAFRYEHVESVTDPAPYTAFKEKALSLRRLERPAPPPHADTLRELLEHANDAYPLVTLHQEELDDSVCWIGRVLEIDEDGEILFHEISPDASWEADPSWYELASISRVDFGGAYEEALALVGGPPPGV